MNAKLTINSGFIGEIKSLIENSTQNIVAIRNGKYQAKPVREITGNKTTITLQPESLVLVSGYKLAMGDKGITVD